MTSSPTILIGVGNRDRGDDAVGPVVCDLVDERSPGAIPTLVFESSVIDLAHHWQNDDRVVVVDAGRPGGHPGRVAELDGLAGGLDVPGSVSTHSVDVCAAIELARVLDRLPASLTLIAIEGLSFDLRAPLSDTVRRSAEEVAEQLNRLVASASGHG